jgi:hypothetical protein
MEGGGLRVEGLHRVSQLHGPIKLSNTMTTCKQVRIQNATR